MESEPYLGSPLSNHVAITFEVLTSHLEQHLPLDGTLPTGLSLTAHGVPHSRPRLDSTAASPEDLTPGNTFFLWISAFTSRQHQYHVPPSLAHLDPQSIGGWRTNHMDSDSKLSYGSKPYYYDRYGTV